ncbi:integrase [Duganella qianjiadongensis]|uniref:Integrase n=1 Tax=Duganella qianjiadongensis TaxID=2692176 RepID=A0ABW9VL62_9BURK|nr:integrase [Duganella qianjiadongensis]MYM39796.1 integrase [Duganella qianjiadongensis]
MNNIIQFTARKDLSAQRNLEEFIAMARDHIPTWGHLNGFTWDAVSWPTLNGNIWFTNQENTKVRRKAAPSPEQLLQPAFMEAAKAYLRHRHHTKPHKNLGREMSALRALEYVLRQDMGVADITKVSERHFQQTLALIGHQKAVAFIAGELLGILKRLADYAIVTSSAHYWNHHYRRDRSYAKTNGFLAQQHIKDKKVPDQDALLAIAEVFNHGYHQPLEDVDVLVTSITALLLCAPTRIMETVRFRIDCLASDQDKNGKTQYYLKYWVPKINSFARKPIPETMAETAIEAIRRLTEVTEAGRRLARHMETHPTKFYRHAKCPNVAANQVLTPEQVMHALGFAKISSAQAFVKTWTGSYKLSGLTLDSLWQIVIKVHQELNPYFPYQEPTVKGEVTPLKMSESLLCCLRSQFATTLATSPVLLAPFNRGYYAKRLDADVENRKQQKNYGKAANCCFYTRHGFEPFKFKSHSVRHMLNRLAKQSGGSIDIITAWSSRSTNRQTLTYLDNDQGEAAVAVASLMGHEVEQSTKAPVTSEEAEIYSQGPIHRNRYGLCRRSWRIGPCNKFADCLNCSEVLICKGDRFAADVIASEREELAKTYQAAEDAVGRGERPATRWMKVSGPQIKKLDALLSILNDPLVPDGSPITLTGTDFSHEQTLVNGKAEEAGVKLLDRTTLAIEYGEDLLACLDELRS